MDAVLERAILERMARLPHGRAGFKQLVREMHAERRTIQQALDALARRGALIELRGDQYVLPGRTQEFATGRVTLHRDGYGFVVPDVPPPGLRGDVFLSGDATGGAMHGDRVLARITRVGADGRAEGEVLRILDRAHPTVVGEFHVGRHENYVEPHDPRLGLVIIPPGAEGLTQTANVDRIAAPTYKLESARDLDGFIVNAEVTGYPDDQRDDAVGRVIEILGRPDDFGVDVEIVIRNHHLPHRFPAEALEQAQSIPCVIAQDEIARRRDFRAYDVVTIDGETARDFDDAVWVDRLANGHYALHVHIADVSHYVRPGTPIDVEALQRGTSVYFPDRAVPMLPLELSTGICSLKPQVDRLVLSALLEIDHRGDIVGQEFCRGVIRSAERMTYTNVYLLLERNPPPRLERMKELAVILNRKRQRRGSIDFDLPEPQIQFDEQGIMTGVARSERNIAHRIIEEFMLAANEAVAAHLAASVPESIYRIHETPDPKKLMQFEEIAARFGYTLGFRAIEGKEQTVSSRAYQKLIAKLEGKPEERVLGYLMLRSLKQARYSADNRGHYALAAETYTHFTSPIRRYPDLIVHRLLSATLDGRAPDLGPLEPVARECSETERRAQEAERELVEWKKVKYMIDRVGDEFPALIISATRFGFFVELDELFIEGLVPIGSLPGERFLFQENARLIVGERSRLTFRIGDKVTVRLEYVDAVEKKLQFGWVAPQAAPRRRRK